MPQNLPSRERRHSRYFVRDFLRQQNRTAGALKEAMGDRYFDEWKRSYNGPKLKSPALTVLAREFQEAMIGAGALEVASAVKQPSRSAPSRECHTVAGFVPMAVSLGRGWRQDSANTFKEACLLLELCRAEFTPKKVTFGVGYTGIGLTQHVLERIYERTEIDEASFTSLLHEHLFEYLAGVSLSEAGGLWQTSETGFSRITAVPYAHGLMIVDNRILFAEVDEGELGFRVQLPSAKQTQPYLSHSSRVDTPEATFGTSRYQMAVLTCGRTYLDMQSLRDEQQDYFYAFEALRNGLDKATLLAMIYCYMGPQLAHESQLVIDVPDALKRKLERTKSLLGEWLVPEEYSPECFLLPFEG